jgi:hypothetical protein
VSLSRLWIDAFPGIEWSRSITDMLRYAASRIVPSQEAQLYRKDALRTPGWASESPWHRLPQHRRILRWIISRPTRPPAMHTVRAALAQPR